METATRARTPSQQKRIDSIRRRLEYDINKSFDTPAYEIYRWEESDTLYSVSIVAYVDIIDAKNHWFPRVFHVFVGPKGGVRQVIKGMKRHQHGFVPWKVSY